MTPEAVEATMRRFDARIEGRSPHPKPLLSFEHAGFSESIMGEIRNAAFPEPTHIQSMGWPIALSGRDMVGIAQTGSGKTLAFLLPALVHIAAQPPLRPGDGPVVLIMAPTRELAMQTQLQAEQFGGVCNVRNTAVFGGVSRWGQASSLRQGVEICIAT